MVFTREHKSFIIESYFRNGIHENGQWIYSVQACMVEFQQKFPDIGVLEYDFARMVRKTVDLFRQTGSIERKKGSGRLITARTQETIADVNERLLNDPTKSLRRISQEVNLSLNTCHKIARKDLHLTPYRMKTFHELLPPDHARRLTYCQWFTEHLMQDDGLLDLTFFSDESWCHLSGYVNSQTMRYWSAENPHIFRETPLHPVKVGIFVAVSRRRIIGPIFFDYTINGERYRNNILQVFFGQLRDDELQRGYFQQDGARAHTARETIAFIRQFFGDRVISLGCRPEFPPRSPDLTPLDYFLFPHLKNTIFKTPIPNVEELRDRITEVCANITPQMLENTFENMKLRVQLCLRENGGHFQQFL